MMDALSFYKISSQPPQTNLFYKGTLFCLKFQLGEIVFLSKTQSWVIKLYTILTYSRTLIEKCYLAKQNL